MTNKLDDTAEETEKLIQVNMKREWKRCKRKDKGVREAGERRQRVAGGIAKRAELSRTW